MDKLTSSDLEEVRRMHFLWLNGEGGARADLRYANLSGADLRGADLRGADLSGADLRGADLRGADLRGADLSDADLSDANLSAADLRGANLSGADLRGADLSDANLSAADLSGANLILGGQDIRGYLFWAFREESDVIIRAGCRRFVGFAAARAHWEAAHIDDAVLHEDCLSLVARLERMAAARGWKLEV